MTCRQARQLLAAYRRDDLSPGENAELQAHLRECAECRAQAAEFRRVGEALRSLPTLAPPPDFYARVMAAVQAEEQQDAERAQAAQQKPEKIVVPGMTDVSYLPTLRRAVTERRARVVPLRPQMSPAGAFALRYGAALAALFMIFALGVSVGLFVLLRSPGGLGSSSGGPGPSCISHCPEFLTSVYNADPAYPLVADATASADGQFVIYAAHNASGNWMLEELNRQTGKSTELLAAPVAGPLTLEGWARSWVLWVQGTPGAGNHWELDATELSPALPGAAPTMRLLQGNQAGMDGTVKALHGVHALGSTVLLAEELANGHGQLVSLNLAPGDTAARSVIATAQLPDHLISDPTAVTDQTTGKMTVYWVDQWQDPDGALHGNIWRLAPGGAPEAVTTNGVSFSPMIVSGKLFWLEEQSAQNAGTASGQPTPTPTPSPTAVPGSGNGGNSQVAGIIWSENLDGRPDLDTGSKEAISGSSPVSNPRAGATFIVWQDSKGDYHLYDVPGDSAQLLNSSISNPLALSVAPTAVLWVTNDSPNSSQMTVVKTELNLLDWPQK
jgi:hypothetical protein